MCLLGCCDAMSKHLGHKAGPATFGQERETGCGSMESRGTEDLGSKRRGAEVIGHVGVRMEAPGGVLYRIAQEHLGVE